MLLFLRACWRTYGSRGLCPDAAIRLCSLQVMFTHFSLAFAHLTWRGFFRTIVPLYFCELYVLKDWSLYLYFHST